MGMTKAQREAKASAAAQYQSDLDASNAAADRMDAKIAAAAQAKTIEINNKEISTMSNDTVSTGAVQTVVTRQSSADNKRFAELRRAAREQKQNTTIQVAVSAAVDNQRAAAVVSGGTGEIDPLVVALFQRFTGDVSMRAAAIIQYYDVSCYVRPTWLNMKSFEKHVQAVVAARLGTSKDTLERKNGKYFLPYKEISLAHFCGMVMGGDYENVLRYSHMRISTAAAEMTLGDIAVIEKVFSPALDVYRAASAIKIAEIALERATARADKPAKNAEAAARAAAAVDIADAALGATRIAFWNAWIDTQAQVAGGIEKIARLTAHAALDADSATKSQLAQRLEMTDTGAMIDALRAAVATKGGAAVLTGVIDRTAE